MNPVYNTQKRKNKKPKVGLLFLRCGIISFS